jgi:predicted DNA-binding transcriptional regulator AlpA
VSAPRRPRTTPSVSTNASRSLREQVTVDELCAELKVARRTFYDWRAKGRAPRCLKLPNGDLRIRRVDLDEWLNAREEA